MAQKVHYAVMMAVALGFLGVPIRPSGVFNRTAEAVIVGGSAAKGWYDASGQGYVERGLTDYGTHAGLRLSLCNQAVPGSPVVNPAVHRDYSDWLKASPDSVVVLAWGLLNDVRLRTPPAKVGAEIHWEISQALKERHVVLIISPPATRPTFTMARRIQPILWREEVREAHRFHNPNIYVVNVLPAMKRYMKAHHHTYRRYMAGLWDPNTLGHVLAGRLLAQQLSREWQQAIPRFVVSSQYSPDGTSFQELQEPLSSVAPIPGVNSLIVISLKLA